MLKRPSSRFPARTTRCVPSGTSCAGATAYSRGSRALAGSAIQLEPEEADRVLAHDLPARLATEGQAEDVLRVVEIVMRPVGRSEEHTSELQSRENIVCRLLLEKKK